MKKILVTGFPKFLDHTQNISQGILKEIEELAPKQVLTKLLPVSQQARTILNSSIDSLTPDIVLMMGLNHRLEIPEWERFALNWISYPEAKDNEGKTVEGEKINSDQQDWALSTQLDILLLKKQMNEFNLTSAESCHAGTYICNLIYFSALERTGNSIFLHLPDQKERYWQENSITYFAKKLIDVLRFL